MLAKPMLAESRFAELASGVTVITGTDTDVGKTVATAWLASALAIREVDVVTCKPAQTGVVGDEGGDTAAVAALAGIDPDRTIEHVRLPEPLAPTTAARRAGIDLPTVADHADRIAALAGNHTAVVVEGAGGILVGLDGAGRGLLELADELLARRVATRFVVVTRPGLGTLNHTALTVAAIRARGHTVAGLVIGAIPAQPGLAEVCNLAELPEATGTQILITLPAGLGTDPERLRRLARRNP